MKKLLVFVSTLFVLLSAHAAVPAKVDVYFSPNGGCRDAVLGRIRKADSTIDAARLWAMRCDRSPV